MDVVDTLRVVARRKWIVLPVLILTFLLATMAMLSIPPEYTARSSVLVYGFNSAPSPVTPALLAGSLQDGETVEALQGEGATAPYTVASDSAGFLTVTARGLTADSAVETANAVLEQMPETLAAEEDGFDVAESDRTTVSVVSAPSTATQSDGVYTATGSARMGIVDSSNRTLAPDTLRDSLTEVLGSAPVAEDLAEQGATAEYVVTYERSSPLIRIEAVATDQEEAVTTAALLTEVAETEAEKLAGTSEANEAELTQPLVVPESASVSRKGPLRSVAAIAIVGIGLAICLAVAAEAYAQWQRSRSRIPARWDTGSARVMPGSDRSEADELDRPLPQELEGPGREERASGDPVRTGR